MKDELVKYGVKILICLSIIMLFCGVIFGGVAFFGSSILIISILQFLRAYRIYKLNEIYTTAFGGYLLSGISCLIFSYVLFSI